MDRRSQIASTRGYAPRAHRAQHGAPATPTATPTHTHVPDTGEELPALRDDLQDRLRGRAAVGDRRVLSAAHVPICPRPRRLRPQSTVAPSGAFFSPCAVVRVAASGRARALNAQLRADAAPPPYTIPSMRCPSVRATCAAPAQPPRPRRRHWRPVPSCMCTLRRPRQRARRMTAASDAEWSNLMTMDES